MNIVLAIVLACIVQYLPSKDFQRYGDNNNLGRCNNCVGGDCK